MTGRSSWLTALPVAALVAVSVPVLAQEARPGDETPPTPPTAAGMDAGADGAAGEEAPSPLATWDPASIENPVSATELIGATVTDERGDTLGAIEDVAVNQNDLSVIAIVLPDGRALGWDEARIAHEGENLVVSAQGRPGRLNMKQFEDTDIMAPGRQADAVRVSELLDKDMLLNDQIRYGDVVDLIFDSTGLLVAAEAQYNGPTVTRYALPVPPEAGLDPDADHILLPFDFKDVKNMTPVDIDAG